MRKCANISPYMRRPLVKYDFSIAPFWRGKFHFLFHQWVVAPAGCWNWGEWTQRIQIKRVLPLFPGWACHAGTRDFFVLPGAALVGLLTVPYTISIPLSPTPSKLGRQWCRIACLLVCVSDLTNERRRRASEILRALKGQSLDPKMFN